MSKNSKKDNDSDEKTRHEIQVEHDLSAALSSDHTPESSMESIKIFNEAWEVEDLLSPEECREIIARTEKLGYGVAPYDPRYRGNLRLIVDDHAMAERLWPRVQQLLGANFEVTFKRQKWVPVGVNTRFRFSKYHPGTRFDRHVDTYFENGEQQSMLTVNIYLNENSAATRFYSFVKKKQEIVDVLPRPGRALIFRQAPEADYLHAGLNVVDGLKYLMRTDVMFVKKK